MYLMYQGLQQAAVLSQLIYSAWLSGLRAFKYDMQKNQTALFLGICFPCSSLQSDFLQKYPRQKMTFHTNWLNCYRNWFSEIHGAAEEQPLIQLTVQEFSGQYKQSLWGLSMSWEYFWHSNYNALNTSDSLSASIYIFKQCMFNICTFSFFYPFGS